MSDDEHDKDEKLRNSEEKLHNSRSNSGKRNEAAGKKEKDTYTWYGPTGKTHSAPRSEDGSVRLADLVLDEEEVYAYRLNEIAKHTEQLRFTTPKPTQTQSGAEGAKLSRRVVFSKKNYRLCLAFRGMSLIVTFCRVRTGLLRNRGIGLTELQSYCGIARKETYRIKRSKCFESEH